MPWLFCGAVNGFLAVALGAFAAHALRSRLSAELLVTFETGVRYQAYHALALLGVGLWTRPGAPRAVHWGGALLLAGIILFSGSLYALALSGVRALGAITPLGGLALLGGWAFLAWAALR
jgi:uncharacterized membrane protein YgdD (TMEM256/DUF423 family)